METRVFRRWAATVLSVAVAATLLIPAATAAQPEPIQAALVENGPVIYGEPTLRAEEALITRHEDKLVFEVRMDTPDPGSYVYPDTVEDARKAPPEVFTAWAFVFNNPEHCKGMEEEGWEWCGAADFSHDVRAGVYGVAGHVTAIDHEGGSFILDRASDGQMIMRGEIALGDQPWPDLPPGETTYPLSNPLGAEVHLAIAPHGQVDPATIAEELYGPAGTPLCGCWWLSFFGLEGYDGPTEA